jgi:ABC-type transporter Mla maintaining outer membrane lipid asymmetry ATPase subunit MlaF
MLFEGKLIFDGTSEEVRNSTDDRVKRFVLGEASLQELQTLETSDKN